MNIAEQLKHIAAQAISELYQFPIVENNILTNASKPEFTGDYTEVLFSLLKQLKKSPEILGKEPVGKK